MSIYVTDACKATTFSFQFIKVGDVFRFDGHLYIKVDDIEGTENAFNITANGLTQFGFCADVEPVVAELVLHPPGWFPEHLTCSIHGK